MNPQRTFDAWKTQRSRIGIGQDFADRVMAGIRRNDTAQTAGTWHSLLRYVTAHSWAKAAVLAAGTLLGLARIAVTIHLVLFV